MNRVGQTCIAAVLVLGIVGCASTAPYDPGPQFSPDDYSTWTQGGDGTINGRAFVRIDGSSGGIWPFGDDEPAGVVTCAGTTISAMPATPFFSDYLATAKDEQAMPAPPPAMQALIHTTTCDASGAFSFHHLAPARWLLTTGEGWTLDDDPVGGWINTTVTVDADHAAKVTLSRKR
ncbi:MAG TPA: hypothetical protein VFJ15_08680 [Oleiagrimonas sp.]|nr:hypothetical protein [Oleiagrimonas sp.]